MADNAVSWGKILLPISIGSAYFRSAPYAEALLGMPKDYEKCIFFIADRLQIFNRGVETGERVGTIIQRFYSGNDYLTERSLWLRRLGKRQDLSWIRSASVIGIDEISDRNYALVHRNLNLLYACDQAFRIDIDSWADTYLNTLDTPSNLDLRLKHRLSVEFVLEEVAYNLRLRVFEEIDSEFYPGKYPEALLRLYLGQSYSATVEELCCRPPSSRQHRFFSISTEERFKIFKGKAKFSKTVSSFINL